MAEGWFEHCDRLYQKCIDLGKGKLPDTKLLKIMIDYGVFLHDQNQFQKAESLYDDAMRLMTSLGAQAYEPDVAMTLNNLGNLYYKTQRLSKSEAAYTEALEIYRRLTKDNPQAYESTSNTRTN